VRLTSYSSLLELTNLSVIGNAKDGAQNAPVMDNTEINDMSPIIQ